MARGTLVGPRLEGLERLSAKFVAWRAGSAYPCLLAVVLLCVLVEPFSALRVTLHRDLVTSLEVLVAWRLGVPSDDVLRQVCSGSIVAARLRFALDCAMASSVPKPSQAPWVSRMPTTPPQKAVALQTPDTLAELQKDMSTALCMLKVQSEQIKLLQGAMTVCCEHQEKLLGLFAEGAVKQRDETVFAEGLTAQVTQKQRPIGARPLGVRDNAAVGSGGLRGTPKPAIGSHLTRGVGVVAKSVAKSASAKPSGKRKVISPLAK
eukprot:6491709-Amphidinium_carterae.1